MKSIGRVRYDEPSARGYLITRWWAIPEGHEKDEEMWQLRDDWLEAIHIVDRDTVFIQIYKGGFEFMMKTVAYHKVKGWRVILH